MTMSLKIYRALFFLFSFLACQPLTSKQTSEVKQDHARANRNNQKDNTIILDTADSANKYTTELWVSDPECTECKDCYVDSGEVKIPEVLRPYVKSEKDLLLTCKNPYELEKTYYVKYKLKGHVIGVKNGYLLFCVSEWERR